MSRCDDYCCNYGCNQGRNFPARIAQPTPFDTVPEPSTWDVVAYIACFLFLSVVTLAIVVGAAWCIYFLIWGNA